MWVSLKNASISFLGLVSLPDFASPSSVLVNWKGSLVNWDLLFSLSFLFFRVLSALRRVQRCSWSQILDAFPFINRGSFEQLGESLDFFPQTMSFPFCSTWLVCRLDVDFLLLNSKMLPCQVVGYCCESIDFLLSCPCVASSTLSRSWSSWYHTLFSLNLGHHLICNLIASGCGHINDHLFVVIILSLCLFRSATCVSFVPLVGVLGHSQIKRRGSGS